MVSSTIRTFTDPDEYLAGLRARRVEGIVTARGDFRAELTRIDFDRVWMQRADEILPRVLDYETALNRAAIIFATGQDRPAMHVGGMVLAHDEIIWLDPRLAGHHRSQTACRWGSMSLTYEELAAASEAVIGHELALPSSAHRIRPPTPALSRLLNLHEGAGHLAKTAPDILANPEVARAMEQALAEAMVWCLASGDPVDRRSVHGHHAMVMRRLEAVLHANPDDPLYMTELCAATGVSYPTLRACCQEHLGMGPKRYLLLRRMHLARRALRRADPETTTVTQIATDYGFWELGRFSVMYRSLFGESPSAALRRRPED